MKKILAVLCIGILAMTIGCASEAKPVEPQIKITLDMTRSYYDYYYISERGNTIEADQGKMFFQLYFIVENNSYKKGFDFHGYSMKLECENVQYDRSLYIGPNELQDLKLMPGGKTEGFILFEVPETAKCKDVKYMSNLPIEMEYIANETTTKQ